jgi:hypothetical protein
MRKKHKNFPLSFNISPIDSAWVAKQQLIEKSKKLTQGLFERQKTAKIKT